LIMSLEKTVAIVTMISILLAGGAMPDLALPEGSGEIQWPVAMAEPIDPQQVELPAEPDPPEDDAPSPASSEKIAYLTFDDGPDARQTPQILDILRQYGAKATFFVVGNRVRLYPDLVRRIRQEGHTVGNHTYSHVYSEIYQNPTAFMWSLEYCNRAIEAAIGERTMFVRAPGGSITASGFRTQYGPVLHRHGYRYYDWNVDSQDAINRKQTAAQMADRVVAAAARLKNPVILMHDLNTPTTVQALPLILQRLQALGYSFHALTLDAPLMQFGGR
jgi:peptidoglycan/xylan/chitin deacetylase (PgdA/CDA1 family)